MIVWSRKASNQLDAVFEYISLDSPVYGLRFVEKIIERVELLASQPESGRIVPEISDPEIREFLIDPYRIIYRVEPDQIEVITVIHSARLLGDIDQ